MQTHKKTSDKTTQAIASKPERTSQLATPKEQTLEANGHNIVSETKRSFMTAEAKNYWVKKPGTGVYNSRHILVRSLRLQPKVTVHKEVDGWGLIDTHKDEWVKMSDITLTQPADMLAGPQESTELPKITVEEMMKAGEE